MRFLYDIGIRLYSLAARILALWNPKARLWVRGRRNWEEPLEKALGGRGPVLWYHCASLGEFEQGRPVLEAMKEACPDKAVLLTFFSPSGYEKRKDYPGADHVMYLPLDTRRNARRFFDRVQVDAAIFIKYEFWYHFLTSLHRRQIPTYLASGIFRPGQIFFRWYGGWYRGFLRSFTHIFVQNQESARLLESAGIRSVSVAGDTRFDRVKKAAETPYAHPGVEAFVKGHRVLVAGSTWEPDEALLEEVRGRLDPDLRWIIAPHELSAAHVKKLQSRFPGSVLFSGLAGDPPAGARVLIVDSIGQLSYLYRYGLLAYIGGGFGKGIHNILEAAVYGNPVVFGPAWEKFTEAREMLAIGAAFHIASTEEMLSTVHQQLEDSKLLKTSSDLARNYVLERLGATSRIVAAMCKKA
ncbi:MAG: glycosyltransferase N-terminal domain-containing protein [Bacteroidales bacterium]